MEAVIVLDLGADKTLAVILTASRVYSGRLSQSQRLFRLRLCEEILRTPVVRCGVPRIESRMNANKTGQYLRSSAFIRGLNLGTRVYSAAAS
jgi:hypothetical protein